MRSSPGGHFPQKCPLFLTESLEGRHYTIFICPCSFFGAGGDKASNTVQNGRGGGFKTVSQDGAVANPKKQIHIHNGTAWAPIPQKIQQNTYSQGDGVITNPTKNAT